MKHLAKLLSEFRALTLIGVLCLISVSTVKSQPALTKALDYDGDGKADYVVYRPANNTWYFQKSLAGFYGLQFGAFTLDTPVPGDYDGDGKGDIAVWRESNGNFLYLRSSNNTFYGTQFGVAGDEPMARDYDGDGKTDLAVIRRSTGHLIWYISKSSDTSLVAVEFGLTSKDHPAPGDYDGDGVFDFAVQRCDAGIGGFSQTIFYILESETGRLRHEIFGIGTDSVIPGDYDGDGKTDVAVARDIGGNDEPDEKLLWLIRRSSDGSDQAIQFGDADLGDIPAQADYNGDGRTDIAVWRYKEARFYVKDGASLQFGSDGDLPIASYDTH